MSEKTEGEVHFTVDGEGITDLARNVLLSEDPGHAWRIMSSLIGEGSESVGKAVLDGTMKLVNAPEDDTLLMAVDEDEGATERYLADLRYIYAGRIRMDGTWWRPVAVIKKYGPESAAWACMGPEGVEASDGIRVVRAWADRRAAFFCGKLEQAILMGELPHRQYVIWETCGEPPHWWSPTRTTEKALAEAKEAGRRLEARGEDIDSHEIVAALEADPDVSTKKVRAEWEEAEAIIRQVEYDAALAEIGEKVREQAGNDTFVLVIEADEREHDFLGCPCEPSPAREVVVPMAPFVCWALSRTALRHLSPPWDLVAPTGMKMTMDDPYHTDWMLGAGLDLRNDYGHGSPVTKASYEEMFRLQEHLGDFEATVLVDHGSFRGIVGKDVVVLPNLGPEYAEVAMDAKAIVTEAGGQLAHLAIVAMETGMTIMLTPDATTRYPEGVTLTLDPKTGTIRISPNRS